MSNRGVKPSRINCGHCGASTAVEWVPVGRAAWEAGGRCPSCNWMVHSFFSDDPSFFDSFLPFALASIAAIPDAHVTMYFRSAAQAERGAAKPFIA